MKKNLKNYVLPIILTFGMLFTSCEKDLDENVIQQDSKAIIQRISLNEIENLKLNEKLIETVNKIKFKKIENKHGRFVYNPQFDFYIDDEKGLYIEKDGVKSYTFQILRENTTDKIENIVFVSNSNNEFKIYTTKYTLTPSQIENLFQNKLINVDNTVNNFEINSLQLKNDPEPCYGQMIVSIPETFNSNGQVTSSFNYIQTVRIPCSDDNTSGNNSSISTNSGSSTTTNYDPIGNSSSPTYPTNTGTGTTTSGTGGNTSGNNNPGYTPPATVITTPIASPISREEALLRNTFKNQLTPQQLTFFSSLTNPERSNFYNFLYVNSVPPEEVENVDFVITEYSSVAIGFVLNTLNYLMVNSNLNYAKLTYNRNIFDNNEGDFNNNTIGGYDNNNYQPFNSIQNNWTNIPSVIPLDKFIGTDHSLYPTFTCMDYAKAQIAKVGYKISNYNALGQTFQIYREQTGSNQSQLILGLDYLKYALTNGIPVIVGIDDIQGLGRNIDLSTDHFVVIVGMGSNSNGNYFQFYDNASGYPNQGASPLNLLYYNSTTGIISGSSQCISFVNCCTNHEYIITMIRKSKTL